MTTPNDLQEHFNAPRLPRYSYDRRWIICDPENPDALIYYVWPELAGRIIDLDQRNPKIWKLSERKMQLWVKPSPRLDQLRCVFWSHVYDARALNVKVKKADALAGIIDNTTWDRLIYVDANLAYLIRPIPRIEAAFESLMWRGIKKLAQIIDQPIDFKITPKAEKREYIGNIFDIMRRCERRLRAKSRPPKEVDEVRSRLIKEIKGISFNITPPETEASHLDSFDLEDLPAYDVFEGLEDDEEEEDGPNTGDGNVGVTEEGSP